MRVRGGTGPRAPQRPVAAGPDAVTGGLHIEEHTGDGGHLTLALVGELDASTVAVLERSTGRQLTAALSAMTLDLSELTFIDSTGLAAIVLVSRLCERDGLTLDMVPGPVAVQRLFEITGLLDVLPFHSARPATP